MADVFSLEALQSPLASNYILGICLTGLAYYCKMRLDQEKADAIVREQSWQKRFDDQGVNCEKETAELREEMKEIHRQYVLVSNEVTYLKGFYEGAKGFAGKIKPTPAVGMHSLDNIEPSH